MGSTWSPPPQLRAEWVGAAVEVTTPASAFDVCVAHFVLSDGVTRTFWEQTISGTPTVVVEPIAPVPIVGLRIDAAPLLLTFQGWCQDAEGRMLERVHLTGILVEPDGDRVRLADAERAAAAISLDEQGTLRVGGPAATWTEGPAPVADDDTPQGGE